MFVNNRRSEMEIIREILSLSVDGAKKTQILYQTNLSYAQVQNYLSFLLDKKLLEKQEGNPFVFYGTTQRGKMLLKSIDAVIDFLR